MLVNGATNEFSAQATRLLHFGVSLQDVLSIAAKVHNWLQWSVAMEHIAERYERKMHDAYANNAIATALEYGVRATAYYHFAQYKLYTDIERKHTLQQRSRGTFAAVCGLLSPRVETIRITGKVIDAEVHLRILDPRRPCVLLINGLDSSKEVELWRFGDVFISRGLNVASIDALGQGACVTGGPLLPGFERVVSTVIDRLASRGLRRFGIFGVSFGGHLAARCAAYEQRLLAGVSLGGFFDARVLCRFTHSANAALRHALKLDQMVGVDAIADLISLEKLSGARCSFLIVHGEKDHLVDREQAEAMYRWLRGQRSLWIIPDGEHVCTNQFPDCLPQIGDWMVDALVSSHDWSVIGSAEGVQGRSPAAARLEDGQFTLIDLSVKLGQNPSETLPIEIARCDHQSGALQMQEIFGVPASELPNGQGWASELLKVSTHAGTHMDAPWHYSPTSDGRPSRTIDEIPLHWCLAPGIVLDMSTKDRESKVTPADIEGELQRLDHTLSPGTIVLIYTGAGPSWGTTSYPLAGIGLAPESIEWLVIHGVKVIGTDAWSLDGPIHIMRTRYRQNCDPREIWPAHFAGSRVEYCQLEKLRNLEHLPPLGFTIACFPVPVAGGSAGWTRAVAILPKRHPIGEAMAS